MDKRAMTAARAWRNPTRESTGDEANETAAMCTPLRLQPPQFPARMRRATSPWPRTAPALLDLKNTVYLLTSGAPKGPHAKARGFDLSVPETNGRRRGEEDAGGSNRGRGAGGSGGRGDDDDDAIPQVVFDRMMKRVVFSVATPMAAGVALLYVLSVVKERGVWDVPPWLPFATTLVLFGTSALGIAYGTLSTSWDQDREGSLLGWRETQQNWPELWKDEEEEERR